MLTQVKPGVTNNYMCKMKRWLATINICNNVLLFPVVIHWTEAGSPNPNELPALTLKV